MGSGANIIVLFFLMPYLILMSLFCAWVGSKSTAKMGWAMAAGLVFLPIALYVMFLVA